MASARSSHGQATDFFHELQKEKSEAKQRPLVKKVEKKRSWKLGDPRLSKGFFSIARATPWWHAKR